MSKTFSILIFVAALFCSPTSTYADEAAGQYTMDFSDPVNLWDISGDYEDTIDGLVLDYTIAADPVGRFMGQGSFTYADENGNEIDGDFTFTGRMRSSGKIARVSMHCKLSGNGSVEGFDATLTGSVRKRLEIDSAALQLAGKATAHFRVRAPGFVNTNATVRVADFVSDIPLGMDGTWGMTLNVFPDNSNYTGNATVDLSNGSEYSFNLTGRHTSRDLSKFKLKGDESSPRARFSLTTTVSNDVMTVESVHGRILGQRLHLKQ